MENLKEITIIGCGPGGADLVTPAARKAAEEAGCLIGSGRLLALFPGGNRERVNVGADVQKALDAISARIGTANVAVLVSGDPGLCSLAKPVIKRFGRERCRVVPGVSAVQYAFAAVGVDWRDAELVSAHAGEPNAAPETLAGKPKLAFLAGTDGAMRWIASCAKRMVEGRRIFVCENLSLTDERVAEFSVEDLEGYKASSMTVVLMIKKESF